MISQKELSQQEVDEFFDFHFIGKQDYEKTSFLCSILNRLMNYDVSYKIIAKMLVYLFRMDKYDRNNVEEFKIQNKTILECTGSGKKPIKTLNISTPSIITAVAGGATIIKKGSRATSSKLGSVDFLEKIGFKKFNDVEMQKEALIKTGFAFAEIESVIPTFNKVYEGYFFKPHILSYALAALVTTLKGNKLVYGLSLSDVNKSIKAINEIADTPTTVFTSVDAEKFYDEIVPAGTIIKASYNRERLQNCNYSLGGFSHIEDVKNAVDVDKSIKMAIDVLKGNSYGAYGEFIAYNAAFYLMEANVKRAYEDALETARNILSTGRAYEKLEEIVDFSGGCIFEKFQM